MNDLLIPDNATIAGWIADWGSERIGGLEHYLARRGAIWAQQTRRRSLLERARDELDTIGLHEALGDFKLDALKEVVRLYGLDH
ncbi:MAG: hypothetical protein ACO242_04720 [Candidatus Fonsibacter ubiquis]